jgi:hypothetical protein
VPPPVSLPKYAVYEISRVSILAILRMKDIQQSFTSDGTPVLGKVPLLSVKRRWSTNHMLQLGDFDTKRSNGFVAYTARKGSESNTLCFRRIEPTAVRGEWIICGAGSSMTR